MDQLKNDYTSYYYLPYRRAKAWGKHEKLVEGKSAKVRLKAGYSLGEQLSSGPILRAGLSFKLK